MHTVLCLHIHYSPRKSNSPHSLFFGIDVHASVGFEVTLTPGRTGGICAGVIAVVTGEGDGRAKKGLQNTQGPKVVDSEDDDDDDDDQCSPRGCGLINGRPGAGVYSLFKSVYHRWICEKEKCIDGTDVSLKK